MEALKAVGFQVVAARDDNQARIMIQFLRFHAVVLCHPLHRDVQNTLVPDLRAAQPGLPILELREQDREPEKLIAAITALDGDTAPESPPKMPYLSCWARCTGLEQIITR